MNKPLVMGTEGSCSRRDLDFSIGAVDVKKPVGELGGRMGNLPDDVRTIQNAINSIPVSRGGRKGGVLLEVDGKCGPKTKAAILQYQAKNFGGGDTRVDPGGRTARQMGLDLSGPLAPDEQLVALILSCVPQARVVITAAQFKLGLARAGFEGEDVGIMTSSSQAARDMVNKHFSLDKFPDWRPEFERLYSVFSTMLLASARQDGPLAQWQGIFVPNTATSEEQGADAAAAYTYAGGYRDLGKTADAPFPQRTDRIYICRPMAKKTHDFQTFAIVHELAHYCGGGYDSPNMIDDVKTSAGTAYGWIDSPAMQALLPWWKTRNANNFATFAWDSAYGRQPCGL